MLLSHIQKISSLVLCVRSFVFVFVFFLCRLLLDHRLIIPDTARTLKTNKIVIFGRPFRYSYNTKHTLCSTFCFFFFPPPQRTVTVYNYHVISTTHFHYRRKGEKKTYLTSLLVFPHYFLFFFNILFLQLTGTSR